MSKQTTKAKLDMTMTTDVYGRHMLAQHVIEKVFRPTKDKKLTILDVGGYKGRTAEFLPKDQVTVLDVYDDDSTNYIKGDATAMTFADNTYNLVTSFDVFEHIPRTLRKSFVSESVRVAKDGVIMTMPIDDVKNGATHDAEVRLDEFFFRISGEHHPWLKEHIEYGIPDVLEVTKLLDQGNYAYKIFFSDNRTSWQILQMINFSATTSSEGLNAARHYNAAYNALLDDIEPVQRDGYRAIVVITKTPSQTKKLEQLHQAMPKQHQEKGVNLALQGLSELLSDVLVENKRANHLEQELADQRRINVSMRNELKQLTNSHSWRLTKPLRALRQIGENIHGNNKEDR